MYSSDIFTVIPEKMAAGGSALAKRNGKTVFINYCIPGETVKVRLVRDHGDWAEAELIDVIKASPDRTEALCPYFGICGACAWQHISYEAQLQYKKQILQEALVRTGQHTSFPEIHCIASAPYEYRNRMQLHRNPVPRKGTPPLGLKKQGSNTILPISDCPIADKGIRQALERGSIVLPPSKNRFTVFSRADLFLSEGNKSRASMSLLDKQIRMDVSCFFQSNVSMLEKLIPEILRYAASSNTTMPAADLYSGVGSFALFLQDIFPQVDLMEANKVSLNLARENLKRSSNRYFALNDEKWSAMISKKGAPTYAFAVMDPPRAGLSPSLRNMLIQNGPPLLAYVSCDPVSLSRDIGAICADTYRIHNIFLYDFYPQTAHIETLVLLERQR